MALKKDIITSVLAILALTLLCGILYPLVITGVSQVAFPGNANGQQINVGGKLVGSKIIGQNFADPVVKNGKPVLDKNGNPVTVPDPRYFQTRPSATVPPHNAAATAFSNLGPNNVATEQAIVANIRPTSAREALRPGPDRGPGPGRRRQQLGVRHRPGHLARQRRHPGPPHRRGPPPPDDAPSTA